MQLVSWQVFPQVSTELNLTRHTIITIFEMAYSWYVNHTRLITHS